MLPICLDTQDPEKVMEAVRMIAPVFGGINLEDIASPACFTIEETLERELDIPVFHDDQHGTAIVVTAAFAERSACGKQGHRFDSGRSERPGCSGHRHHQNALAAGVKDVIACDENGILYKRTRRGHRRPQGHAV